MPAKPVALPAAALQNMSETASGQVLSPDKHLPFDVFSSVTYSGLNGGTPVTGLFVEVDSDTWVENDTFTFSEISETRNSLFLFDASRDLTIEMNFKTDDLIVSFGSTQLLWEITGVTHSFTPVIPEGWLT